MKLIIQIPCRNEEEALPVTLRALPREVEGFDRVEWLVIDDGCTDRTVAVALENGVDHIVSLKQRQGLARAFMAGLQACLKAGADVIVNTDADNQYCAQDIPSLVRPILDKKADIVVGARPIAEIRHFSPLKKLLQAIGSWVVRVASKTSIPDAPSGFRAMSKEAAMKLNVFNNHTYTLETIIQAGQKNMAIISIPVRVNDPLRPSRLIKSIPSYILASIMTVVRILVVYRPFRFFLTVGMSLLSVGILIGVRFLFYYFAGNGKGHIQSLILAGILIGMGFQTVMTAFLADLTAVNRHLIEELQFKLREIGSIQGEAPSSSRIGNVAGRKE